MLVSSKNEMFTTELPSLRELYRGCNSAELRLVFKVAYIRKQNIFVVLFL